MTRHGRCVIHWSLSIALFSACGTGAQDIEAGRDVHPVAASAPVAQAEVREVLKAALTFLATEHIQKVQLGVVPDRDILVDPSFGESFQMPTRPSGEMIPAGWLRDFQRLHLIAGVAPENLRAVKPPPGRIRLNISKVLFNSPDSAEIVVAIAGKAGNVYRYSLSKVDGGWEVTQRQLLFSIG
jgi:hypothetical protein